jgi:hypothetical protein
MVGQAGLWKSTPTPHLFSDLRILKGFKSNVSELRMIKDLQADFMELRILKELAVLRRLFTNHYSTSITTMQ